MLKKLSARGACFEAGLTGYGLYRQVRASGFECFGVAPSFISLRAGDRVKTDRLDAIRRARRLRAGELTPIWVLDETHEAMRDLVRARAGESAAEEQRPKRQLVSAFTRAGNSRVRYKLIEDAWTYRRPAPPGARKLSILQEQSAAVQDIAWKAQSRLTARDRNLSQRRKTATVVTPAIARAAFMWDIARHTMPARGGRLI